MTVGGVTVGAAGQQRVAASAAVAGCGSAFAGRVSRQLHCINLIQINDTRHETTSIIAMKQMPSIRSVMTRFPHSVDVSTPIATAVELIRTHGIAHLPVTDQGELVGIVTDRDIKLLLGTDYYSPARQDLDVYDVYTPDPVVVSPDERLDNVVMAMAERRIGSVLVTENGRLAGIFTAADACRCFAEHLRSEFGPPPDDQKS